MDSVGASIDPVPFHRNSAESLTYVGETTLRTEIVVGSGWTELVGGSTGGLDWIKLIDKWTCVFIVLSDNFESQYDEIFKKIEFLPAFKKCQENNWNVNKSTLISEV